MSADEEHDVVTSTPRVSVIIPTYNRSGYLVQAIGSVVAQTYADWEAIIIDDGSSDDTAAVVAAIGDPRIRYKYQKNAGRSAARNRGLALARGAFIAFLDDDDLYLPRKLEWQVGFLQEQTEVGLVASGVLEIDRSGSTIGRRCGWESREILDLQGCLRTCPVATCGVLLRKEAVRRLGEWFDNEMAAAEDTDFFVRLLYGGCQAAWLKEVVAAVRLHTHNLAPDGERYTNAYIRVLDKFFTSSGVPQSLREQKNTLYAYHYLVGACSCVAAGQTEAFQRDLCRALSLDRGLLVGHPVPLAASIARFAQSRWVPDSDQFVEAFFGALPVSLAHLGALRKQTRGAMYMSRFFDGTSKHKVSDGIRGMCNDPRWFLNRGVRVALIRAIVGRTGRQ